MNSKRSSSAELAKTVLDVREGKRVVVLPPGVSVFALNLVLFLLAIALFTATTGSLLFIPGEYSAKAMYYLTSVVVLIVPMLVAVILLVRGDIWFKFIFQLLAGILFLVSVVLLVYVGQFTELEKTPFTPILFLLGVSVASILSCRSFSLQMFCEYFYLLKRVEISTLKQIVGQQRTLRE
ncbi:hypothetical protein OLMES_1006 [Oleiphilus messinensis]|uniref:Uncharacterized protein n=1 Tax=Oleiphilus messinensis TaxID=141451 RepID=A0A1Y0I3P0_9GAMM|nr:hypothetical protein [Oleiphilus messinensis]ARU55092.1 hypothetical protein OLMES_1006 [Oleiphilus messinensis]